LAIVEGGCTTPRRRVDGAALVGHRRLRPLVAPLLFAAALVLLLLFAGVG
jgi:hypothetical protein